MLAGRQSHNEFLYESGYIAVGYDFAFPFLDVEHAGRNLYAHVFLHFHLAAETPIVLYFLTCEMHGLSRQDFASAFRYLHAALSAATLASTCRRQEHIAVGQR